MTRLAAGLAALVLLLTSCSMIDLNAPGAAPPPAPPPADVAGLFAKLVVAEEDTGAHYERDEWGEDWATHADGCSTRELVLLEQSGAQRLGARRGGDCAPTCPRAADHCWVSPYDGRPATDAGELEIDHRVSLKEASRSRVVAAGGKPGKGAARLWPAERKQAFYEDRTNLVAVTSSVNQSKNDDDPGRWRPADRASWCAFATAYVRTKVTYGLTADRAEHDALGQMLGTCRR